MSSPESKGGTGVAKPTCQNGPVRTVVAGGATSCMTRCVNYPAGNLCCLNAAVQIFFRIFSFKMLLELDLRRVTLSLDKKRLLRTLQA